MFRWLWRMIVKLAKAAKRLFSETPAATAESHVAVNENHRSVAPITKGRQGRGEMAIDLIESAEKIVGVINLPKDTADAYRTVKGVCEKAVTQVWSPGVAHVSSAWHATIGHAKAAMAKFGGWISTAWHTTGAFAAKAIAGASAIGLGMVAVIVAIVGTSVLIAANQRPSASSSYQQSKMLPVAA